LSFLLAHEEAIDQVAVLELKVRDEANQQMVSEALAAQADTVVTGVQELLEWGRVEELRVVSPRVFWETVLMQSN